MATMDSLPREVLTIVMQKMYEAGDLFTVLPMGSSVDSFSIEFIGGVSKLWFASIGDMEVFDGAAAVCCALHKHFGTRFEASLCSAISKVPQHKLGFWTRVVEAALAGIARHNVLLVQAAKCGLADVIKTMRSTDLFTRIRASAKHVIMNAELCAASNGHLRVLHELAFWRTRGGTVFAHKHDIVHCIMLLDTADVHGHDALIPYMIRLMQIISVHDLGHALVTATRHGLASVVGHLLRAGARANYRDGMSLMFAAATGRVDIVVQLLNAKEHAAKANIDGSAALVIASGKGHPEVVNTLLTAGGHDPDVVGYSLYEASMRGHIDVVGILMADNTIPVRDVERSIINATKNGNTDMVIKILDGVDAAIQPSAIADAAMTIVFAAYKEALHLRNEVFAVLRGRYSMVMLRRMLEEEVSGLMQQ